MKKDPFILDTPYFEQQSTFFASRRLALVRLTREGKLVLSDKSLKQIVDWAEKQTAENFLEEFLWDLFRALASINREAELIKLFKHMLLKGVVNKNRFKVEFFKIQHLGPLCKDEVLDAFTEWLEQASKKVSEKKRGK